MRLTFGPVRSIYSTSSTTRPVRSRVLARLRGALSRKLICLALFSLVMFPVLGLAHEVSLLSSLTGGVTAASVRVVSGLFSMIFGIQEAPPESLVDRLA